MESMTEDVADAESDIVLCMLVETVEIGAKAS